MKMLLGTNPLGIPMQVISNWFRLVAGILVCLAINKGILWNRGLINTQFGWGNLKSPQRSNYLPLLPVEHLCWWSILIPRFLLQTCQSPGCAPEGQGDCKPGQLLAYLHRLAHEWETLWRQYDCIGLGFTLQTIFCLNGLYLHKFTWVQGLRLWSKEAENEV